MNKDLEYYINQNRRECSPRKHNNPLLVDNYLSEFNTDSKKQLALENLGITGKLEILKTLIDNKVIEIGALPWDIEPMVGHHNHILSSDSLYKYFQKYYSKEQMDNKLQAFWNEFVTYVTELSVQVDEELSELSKNAVQNRAIAKAIKLLQPLLKSGVNIKTINGESLLGEGNIQFDNIDLTNYADKQFVRDSISIAAATFRGTYNSLQELQQQEADNNDYGFVQTIESGDVVYNRYKFNGEEWIFEYRINTSSFTPAQWEAINSGITNIDILKINNLPSKQQLDSSFAEKANVSDVYNKSEVYTKQEVNTAIQNIKPEINHVFLTQAQYDALQTYERNTLYLIVEDIEEPEEIGTRFGDKLPIRFSEQVGTRFGDSLPIRFTWVFGGEFPITFS